MKPGMSGPRPQPQSQPQPHTTSQKKAQQKTPPPVNKVVSFTQGSVQCTPTLRSHAAKKTEEHRRLNDSSDSGDDAASSSGSEPESRPVASRETYRFYASWTTLEKFAAKADQSSSESLSTVSSPSSLPNPDDRYPRSPRPTMRLPHFSAPVSMMHSPVGTPRSELGGGEPQRSPRRLASFRKLGRELSRKLENITIIRSDRSDRSDRSSASGSSRGSTPRPAEKIVPLAGFAEGHLDALARRIQALQRDDGFKSSSSVKRNLVVNAEILESLPVDSPLRNPKGLSLLRDEVNKRLAFENSVLDADINLNDPAFSKFVASAADAAFMKPWERDSSDVRHALRGHLESVKPTFARDFENSDYFFRQADGSLKKLGSIDAFLACVKPARSDSNSDLPKIVSNIASQNMGNFLKNTLFLRHDINGVSQSVLRSADGRPLMPLATVKARYILSKDANDAVTIDYTWLSSAEINGDKEMRAKEMMGEYKNIPVERANLEIKARVRVEASGEWTVFDPHIRAKGWV